MKFVETCLTIQYGYFKKGTKCASLLLSPVHLGSNTSLHISRQRYWVQWVIYAPLSEEDLSPHSQELEVIGHDTQISQGETFSHIPGTHSWCDRTPRFIGHYSLPHVTLSTITGTQNWCHRTVYSLRVDSSLCTHRTQRWCQRTPHALSCVHILELTWKDPYSVRSDLSPQAQGADLKRQDLKLSQVRPLPTLREPWADGTGHSVSDWNPTQSDAHCKQQLFAAAI